MWQIEESPGGNEFKANVISKFEDSDYVYSVAVFPTLKSSSGWVTSGENTGIKIFKDDGKVGNNHGIIMGIFDPEAKCWNNILAKTIFLFVCR